MNKKPRQKVHLKCTRGNFNISTKEKYKEQTHACYCFFVLRDDIIGGGVIMSVSERRSLGRVRGMATSRLG